ncbi:MAG: hypothetical protein OXT74_02880 [Candidatus Poribacteria bacterium]|nr:hypothetical protein [Candidatus Poribacteria bacterium]MDE0467780.1 hypothetical protein [Candidatus Poribacteria bacterium]
MRKVDLQQQVVALIEQLSTEKLRAAVDYLSYLQDKDAQNNLPNQDIPSRGLGTMIHEMFKPFGGVELEIPPREPAREPPRFD